MHVSFDKPRGRQQRVTQNVKLNADYVSLNTESCVDQEHFCLLSNEWKDCYHLVKLVVLMLNSPSDHVTKSADRSIEGREFGQPGYKIEKRFKSEIYIDVSIENAV